MGEKEVALILLCLYQVISGAEFNLALLLFSIIPFYTRGLLKH